ncbi:MAG: pyruvate kinase, partial [Oscillospiraceae bacterium]
ASFVTGAEDVLSIRRLLESKHCHTMRIISKIESAKGVENIEEILRVSDGIMVARGDMGVEIPFEDVPVIQKSLIKQALAHGKVVITATQMLDSMTNRPRPTRAEAADVANAIYDGTSAVMLSGETAAGSYPIESVRAMAAIARRTEADINYRKRLGALDFAANGDITYAIAHATCSIAHDLGAGAILPVTYSGYTARMTSSFRPAVPIIACTPNLSTYRHLSLSWGVTPVLMRKHTGSGDEMLGEAVRLVHECGLLEDGEIVVLTAGVPIGIPGTTNLIKVDVVGDVLATGHGIGKASVTAPLCVARDEDEARARFHPGDILVVPSTDNSYLSLLREAGGVITEEAGANSHAAVVGLALDIPAVVGVSSATVLLKNGMTVQLDAARGRIGRVGDSK